MTNSNSNANTMAQMLNAFNPSEPLKAGDRVYVDCASVRGDEDIIGQLGNRIRLANQPTCHLYTGHRGSGKSTELRRLQQYLENNDFFVVYFEADDEDIDAQDVEYVDILIACTRQLLKELGSANAKPILDWLKDRASEFKELMLSEVKLDKLEVALSIFSKFTASIRAEPTQRAKIRSQVDPHTVTLLHALNELIKNATGKLPNGKKKLALIVDNLDRIPLVVSGSDRSNHEEIFLDRAEQLKQLSCHVVYTVPIALVYSKWANDVQTIYGETPILPMIMVQDKSGIQVSKGLEKLKEALLKRASTEKLDNIFELDQAVEKLCLASGGHIRELMQMMQEAINLTDDLPILEKSVNRSISKLRGTYKRTINETEWSLLAVVNETGRILNDNEHRSLLQRRCILEYRDINVDDEIDTFYRVHPLIELLERFTIEVKKLKGP